MNKNVYSVSQINTYIERMFSDDFMLGNLSLSGEVSNCKYNHTGHIYFTLKDDKSSISCVMFAGKRAKGLKFNMKDGDQIVVTGYVGIYAAAGRYQVYANEIELAGVGDLYQRFEALKQELEESGMFDAMYKKPLPSHAMRIGIITAPTGAAVHDIIRVSKTRNPFVELILYPAQVQGEGAVPSIISGINCLDELNLDVIILGRGGGSIEDLWAFNEEPVARAIFKANTPIISAVGHETTLLQIKEQQRLLRLQSLQILFTRILQGLAKGILTDLTAHWITSFHPSQLSLRIINCDYNLSGQRIKSRQIKTSLTTCTIGLIA